MMVTTLYAGILGLIYIVLSAYVIKARFKHSVSLGDGGNADLNKRIRIHANFIEYVPLALLLIVLAEFEGSSEMIIHVLAGGLVLARLLHVFGILTKEGTSFGRAAGMIMTLLVIIAASILCIKAYFIL